MSGNRQTKQTKEVSANVAFAANAYIAANSGQGSLRQQMAMSSIDTKHPQCWTDYGYPIAPTFRDFFIAYKRSGLGKAGIELLPDKCWQSNPWVRTVDNKKAKDTTWEAAFLKLVNRLDLWPKMKMLDYMQRTGRYGVTLMIVADGKKMKEPISGGLSPDSVIDFIPLYESQMVVLSTYEDENESNYGMPEFYEYDQSAIGDGNPFTNNKITVHGSRVIPWAEGASGNSIYGIPALEAGLNNLLNVDKIDGAGAEGFWKNARTPMQLEMDEKASVNDLALMYDCKPAELSDEIAKRLKSMGQGFDNALMLKGIKANPLTVTLPSPKEFAESNKKSFAASIKTPLTLLEGNQSGNQASAENGSTFDEQAESRRKNEIDRFIKKFIKWLERHKVLKANEQYFIFWDSLLEPSLNEKLDIILKMAQVNQTMLGTGEVAFTAVEMREVANYEPLRASESVRSEDIEDVEPEE